MKKKPPAKKTATAVGCLRCERTGREILQIVRELVKKEADEPVAKYREVVAKYNELARRYQEVKGERDELLEERSDLEWEERLQAVYDRRERQRARENAGRHGRLSLSGEVVPS